MRHGQEDVVHCPWQPRLGFGDGAIVRRVESRDGATEANFQPAGDGAPSATSGRPGRGETRANIANATAKHTAAEAEPRQTARRGTALMRRAERDDASVGREWVRGT